MEIEVLGTRGEIKSSSPRHSLKSGILVNKKILFDLGNIKFLRKNPKNILITHLHPDHAFFILNKFKNFQIDIPIYGPETYDQQIKVKKFSSPMIVNQHKIISIPTQHSQKVRSQAYLIIRNNEKILYTGDLISIDKKYHHKLKNLKLVITDASFIRKGGLIRCVKPGETYGHAGIPDLITFFKPFTNHILFIHFGSWFYKHIKKSKKKLNHLAQLYNIHLHIGYDGKVIDTRTLK